MTAPAPMPVAPRATRALCDVLIGVLEAEPEGFIALRGNPLAADAWRGRAVVPGTERCRIEGGAWPQARYACSSAPFDGTGRAGAVAEFEVLAGEIDRCLARPIWFPRRWQKGQRHQFALGEQLQTWTDRSSAPPSAVTLKVEQDLRSRDYRLQLSLETVR